jgi:hypothetical protein
MSHMRPHSFASPARMARTARNKNEHETHLFPSYKGSDKSDYLPQTFDICIYICIYPIVLIYCLLLEPKHTLAYVCFIGPAFDDSEIWPTWPLSGHRLTMADACSATPRWAEGRHSKLPYPL